MTAKAIETWIWVLIYGGLLLLCLGLFVLRLGGALGWAPGWALVVLGPLLALAGGVLLVLRSRLPP